MNQTRNSTNRARATGQVCVGRRRFIAMSSAFGATVISGCARFDNRLQFSDTAQIPQRSIDPGIREIAQMYGAETDGSRLIPAVPFRKIDPRYYRQLVDDPTGEPAGTIVVDTADRFLYHVREGGEAVRYGIGIGRAGFAWSGRAVVQWKQEWPRWVPPADMIARQPELAKYSAKNGGMEPGLDNPLGARALYLFQNGVDTLYRIHGSPEWWSIGKAVSSGCVRLLNQDIIDLYGRVPKGTPVLVA
jgi:lipoprotein-anchoring transpeptidase ErfK/SrfK